MELKKNALYAHVKTGLTTLCRCWSITRKDGVVHGFTDHDLELSFAGVTFKANTGLTASAVEQATGLSIDNAEAMGAISDAAVREEDIEAGRFDAAEVRAWLVNWADTSQRILQFRGSIGELRRGGGAFHAELRGLTDLLNRPLGRVYQKPCTAVLGDENCQINVSDPKFSGKADILQVADGGIFRFGGMGRFQSGWFKRGRLEIISGSAKGLWGTIKHDRLRKGVRTVELWQSIGGGVAVGDQARLIAGCDKRMPTCRTKFENILNFQGFPDLPSEDWVMAVPKKGQPNNGGSRR